MFPRQNMDNYYFLNAIKKIRNTLVLVIQYKILNIERLKKQKSSIKEITYRSYVLLFTKKKGLN